ncbi:hypothetical protein DB41_AU00100 [Neochlamydia sp. TUME1]|nr:hypothetical protein DB41_AU00100 [Neochlamydia sp. TUME1]
MRNIIFEWQAIHLNHPKQRLRIYLTASLPRAKKINKTNDFPVTAVIPQSSYNGFP